MKKSLVILSTIIICLSLHGQKKVNAEAGWKLIYENDENGNKVAGDLHKIIRAVRKGEPIRIGWKIEHPINKSIKVEHFADAQFITILSDSVLFAQIEPIVGQTPDIEKRFIGFKENISWAFCASSLGNNDSMNMNIKTGEILDHKPWRTGIKWFIKSY